VLYLWFYGKPLPTGLTAGMKKTIQVVVNVEYTKANLHSHLLKQADENFPSSTNLYFHQAYAYMFKANI